MKTTKYIWMDGKWKPWKAANIHVITHALHYGGAVFEGIRIYKTAQGPAIFRLEDHIKRFFYSCKTIGIQLPYTEKQVVQACIEVARKNKIQDGYLRPLAYFGYGKMGINPVGAPSNLAIACWPWTNYLSDVPAIKIKTSKYMRQHPKSVVVDAKISGFYSNSILASIEVRPKYHEALFLDYKGDVAEGPGENIFIIKKGVLITPPKGCILPGFTRDSIMKLAKDRGIKTAEKNFKLKDLYSADECFMVGTACEVAPIASCDDKKIGTGSVGRITAELKKAYEDLVHGKNQKYKKWMTYSA